MATYIALNYNTLNSYGISSSDLYYVVNPAANMSYQLTLASPATWNSGGTYYMVYLVGSSSTSYSISGTTFVHLYNNPNIKQTDDLPLNSRIIYASSNNGTYPGNGSSFPSGTVYYFMTSGEIIKTSNVWGGTNPGGVAGSFYTYYNKSKTTLSGGKCTDYGFCPTSSSYGVSIVELYHSTNGVSNATGFYTSIIDRSASQSSWTSGTYKNWIYDYSREADTASDYPARISGTGRKVFAIHNTTGSDCNLAIAYAGSTSTTLSDTNYTIGAFGYTRVAYNTWATHVTQGKRYYSITVNGNNKFVQTSFQLQANKAYTIKMHTYSEASSDGIIISTTPLSSSASLSSGITKCSGVNTNVTYTLASSTSARTLYIYFKTDSSNLRGPGGDYYDSGGTSTTTYRHSTGDIEITANSLYTITFNANGGTGGTTSTTVIAGESLDFSTITKPTRSGWNFYNWSVGSAYFNWPPSPYTPTGNVTLYAIWDNTPKFTMATDRSVYCTSQCSAADSTQGSKSIKLFSGTGMTCAQGTVTYMSSRSSVYPVGSPNSPISGATIQPVGSSNNVTVPSGTPAGDYIASIVVYTSVSTATPGSYFGPSSGIPDTYKIPFTIKATTLTYGPVQFVTDNTPSDPTDENYSVTDFVQSVPFPPSQFTLSASTIGNYFSHSNGIFRQVVSCNNGQKRVGNLTDIGWVQMPNFNPDGIVVPSLGTTETDSYTYTFADNYAEGLAYVVSGEGNQLFQKFVMAGYRRGNYKESTNYSPSDYTASVSIGSGLTAAGGSATVTASASHKAYDYYSSGSYNNQHDVADSVTWSITTQTFTPSGGSASTITRFSKSSNTLSHTTMGTNVGTDYVKVTATNSSKTSATATAEKWITSSYSDSWGDITVTSLTYSYSQIGAGGGTSSPSYSGTITQSGTRTFTSGSTQALSNNDISGYSKSYSMTTGNGFSINTTSGVITAENRTSTTGVARTSNQATVTLSANGKTATKTATCTQAANELGTQHYKNTSGTTGDNWTYGTPTESSITIGSGLSAAGGSAALSCSTKDTKTYYRKYTSGTYTSLYTENPASSITWTITSQTFGGSTITRFSVSGSTLSHTTMGTNVGTDSVTVQAANTNSTSLKATKSTSVTNAITNSDYNASNSDYAVSVSIGSGLNAGASSATVSVSGSHTHTYYYLYTSGSTSGPYTSTPIDSPTWSITSQYLNSSSNTITRFSKSSNTLSHATMGTTTGTDYVTITATNNTATKTASTNVTNSLGTTKYKNTSGTEGYNIVYVAPSCTLTNNLTAADGSVTVTCTVTNNTNWYQKYTSGSYTGQQTGTEAGTARWRITSNGNSRFSHPSSGSSNLNIGGSSVATYATGTAATHSNMTTNATTDTVGITAYNIGDTTKTSGEKTASVTNSLGTTKYKNTSGTEGYNITYVAPSCTIGTGLTAAGGSATVTCTVTNNTDWYQKYTSGSYTSKQTGTEAGTARWMITSNGNSRFSHPSSGGSSLSGVGTVYNNGTSVSHSSMTTNDVTDTVTVTAYNIGDTTKSATASKSITNPIITTQKYKDTSGTTGYNVVYVAPQTCTISSSLTAAGGTFYVTCAVTNNTNWYYKYTSGSYTSQYTDTEAGTAKWQITTNGNSRFSNPSSGGATVGSLTLYPSGSSYKGSHSNMTTNATTDTVTVTAYNVGDTSKTKTASVSVTNSLGTQKYKNTSGTTGYNVVYVAPSCTLTNNLTAADGSVTVTCSVTNNTNWYQQYTSGSYTSLQSGTEAGTARWMITSNGNSRFSHPSSGGSTLSGVGTVYNSGTSASHSNMTTNATTDTVGITAYNVGDATKTSGQKTASVVNEIITTQKYKNTSGTTGYNVVYVAPQTCTITNNLTAAGGSFTVTCAVTNNTNWYYKYTSGSYTSQQTGTETGTAKWQITTNGNSRFSNPSSGGTTVGSYTLYPSGGVGSHSNMTTNATTDTVTVTVYNVGDTSKTKTASASVTNSLTSISILDNGTSISGTTQNINYNQSKSTISVSATYTSGSSKDVTGSLSTSSSATSNYIKSGDTTILTIS